MDIEAENIAQGLHDQQERLKEQLKKLKDEVKQLKQENQFFGDVLAVIHKDGGHYISIHGPRKASQDAIKIILDLRKKFEDWKEE